MSQTPQSWIEQARELGIDESVINKTPVHLLRSIVLAKKRMLSSAKSNVAKESVPHGVVEEEVKATIPSIVNQTEATSPPDNKAVDMSDVLEASNPHDQAMRRYHSTKKMVEELQQSIKRMKTLKETYKNGLLPADLLHMDREIQDLQYKMEVGQSELVELKEWFRQFQQYRKDLLTNILKESVDSTGQLAAYFESELEKVNQANDF